MQTGAARDQSCNAVKLTQTQISQECFQDFAESVQRKVKEVVQVKTGPTRHQQGVHKEVHQWIRQLWANCCKAAGPRRGAVVQD